MCPRDVWCSWQERAFSQGGWLWGPQSQAAGALSSLPVMQLGRVLVSSP